MPVIPVKHRQAGIQPQVQLLDCAIVLDLHAGQLHGRRLLDLDTEVLRHCPHSVAMAQAA